MPENIEPKITMKRNITVTLSFDPEFLGVELNEQWKLSDMSMVEIEVFINNINTVAMLYRSNSYVNKP